MNPTPTIEDQLKDFIAKNLLFSADGFPYSDDASFLGEGIIDSLGVMELVEFVGKRFGIAVEHTEVTPENFDSIRRLSAFARRKQNPESS
jgi:acyl carrier protein